VLKAHRREKFFKDLVLVDVASPPVVNDVTQLNITTAFPRWRQFKRVGANSQAAALENADPDDLLAADGFTKTNIYVVVGTTFYAKYWGGIDVLNVQYYQDPIAIEAGFTSWIATEYPDYVAASAAARVLASSNESEIYKAAKQEEIEQWATIIRSNIEVEGR
jgi:hypothetical protein